MQSIGPGADQPSGASGPKEVEEFEPPRFDVNDMEAIKEFFAEEGYAVVKAVAGEHTVEQAKGMMWNYLESAAEGVSRSDPASWNHDRWPANHFTGIIHDHGIGQSAVNWTLRSLPAVRRAFEGLWDEHDLIVSFDGANVFRPWRKRPDWKTMGGWYHVDQNGLRNPGLQTIQGLVTLLPVNAATGGFVVVPKSHKHHADVCQRNTSPDHKDFVMVPDEDPVWESVVPLLLKCEPGDLVLWDSRTIHCNTPGQGEPEQAGEERGGWLSWLRRGSASKPAAAEGNEDPNSLLRMVCYVCMVPRATASEEVLAQRKEAVALGVTTTHWPNRFNITSKPKCWLLHELTPEQEAMV